MQRVGLTFGVIAGALLSVVLLVGMVLWHNGMVTFETGELYGYTTMLVALSVIFFGIKSYRDKHLRGSIRFWKAVQIGLFISGVAIVMYAITWEVYGVTQPEGFSKFMAEYQQCQIDKWKEDGESEEAIAEKTADMASMMEMYKNPIIRFGITLIEPLPVALVVTLVSAGLLRRREVAPL